MPTIRTSTVPLVMKLPVGKDGNRYLIAKYPSPDTLKALRKSCTVRVLNKKSHQYDEETDQEKFSKLYLSEIFYGFDNLRWYDLNVVLDPLARVEASPEDPQGIMEQLIPESGDGFEAAKTAFLEHGKLTVQVELLKLVTDDDFRDDMKRLAEEEKKT